MPFEHERQLRPDLRLLMRRKHVDDAVDRLRRRVRVQRAERQVARLGNAQRRLCRLQIAQLADEDDVRIFAKGRAQRVGEPVRVAVHLALVDQAALVLMDVLDRILDREDVLVAALSLILSIIAASVVDLPLPVGPVTSTSPRGRSASVGEHLRQAEVLEAFDLLGNQPVDGADGAALVEDVRAEPGDAADAEREVELERLLEALLLRVGHDAVGQLLGLGRRQFRQLEPLQLSMHANLRRRAGRQVEVRALHGRRSS